MKKCYKMLLVTLVFPTIILGQTRDDAGLQGNAGATSGFFETYLPVNYPAGANNWWHLLDVRHSNINNNYAMQFSGSFFDQQLFFRKTNNSATQLWSRVLLETDGKVGIGTTSPTEMLSVKGKIRAQEIRVETTNWPDYVFLPSYKVPTLQEIEKHIKEKGHLPGIPSAGEVKANGVDLGDMNAKLLQKIEELTLHLIEKEKKEKLLQEKVETIEEKLNMLLRKTDR